jgi:hypothetical protein
MISQKEMIRDMPSCFTCLTEYNEAETFTLFGAQKEAEGQIETLSALVKDGSVSVEEEAAGMAGMSVSEFSEKAGL